MKLRIISVLLAMALLVSCLPLSVQVFATGETSETTDTTQTTDVTETTEPSAASEPTEATEPTEVTEPTEETKPTEGTDPSETTNPEDPTQGTEEEQTKVPTKSSQKMVDMLKKLEGFVARAYWDYHQYSIGYGTKCPDDKVEYYKKNDITAEEAEALLFQELATFEKAVTDFAISKNLELSQNEYDALVSFSYNCGYGWTKEVEGNLYNAVVSSDKGAKLVYSMMLWCKAGNEFALLPRRIAELNMFLNGVYEPYKYPDNLRYVFLDGAGGTPSYVMHGFDTECPTQILTTISVYPSGPDETGKTVTYEFDGWYTEREGGTKVELLDENIQIGELLYAHWKLPSGKQVVIPEPEDGVQLKVTIQKDDVSIHKGSQKFYCVVRKVNKGDTVVISEIASVGSKLWGKVYDGWIRLDDGNTNYSDVKKELLPMNGVVKGDVVNVRSGAGTSYKVLTSVKLGDTLSIKDWKSDGSKMWGAFDVLIGEETVTGWISLEYVSCDAMQEKTLTGVKVQTVPTKVHYVQKNDALDISGGQILLTYSDGSTRIVNMTAEMVTGFDNTDLGQKTLTVSYGDFSDTFQVEIIKATVTFQYADGTVISTGQYSYGEEVPLPADPVKEADEDGTYRFVGWDAEVVPCTGNTVYTALFELILIPGDVDKSGTFDDRDAVYLLYHYFFPNDYGASGQLDMNGDGTFDDRDAVYLLYHYFFPTDYPLYSAEN